MDRDATDTSATEPTRPPADDPDRVVFDIREVPFSRRGSWLNLSPVVALHRTSDAVHLVSHRTGFHAVLAMTPELEGSPTEADWLAEPSVFTWVGRRGGVEAAFDDSGALHLRGSGLGLRLSDAAARLTPFTGTYLFTDPLDGAHVFTSYETGRRYRVTLLRGASDVDGAEALGAAPRSVLLGGDGRPWEAVVHETTSSPLDAGEHQAFDEVVGSARADFLEHLDAVAPWRDLSTPAAGLAAYVIWSATVRADGFLRRESVLMSKHWMDKVWSWDHCFNALALAPGKRGGRPRPVPRALRPQDEIGALPDSISHSELLYNYVKPPIHGWALRRLRATAERPLTRPELEAVFDGLARWTTFWLDHRRAPRARDPPLPARQRQRLGQLDHLRRRPRHRVTGPGGLPRAAARGAGRPGRRARPAVGRVAGATRRAARRPARRAVDRRRSSWRGAPCPGGRAPRPA